MPRLIVHTGLHKTGTTFIQNTLYENRENLLAVSGILYPSMGIYARGAGIRHRNLIDSIKMEGSDSFSLRKMREEMNGKGVELAIVSHEGIFKGVDPEFLRTVLGDFEVTVIVYLRNPVDYIESKYRQWLRNRKPFTGEIGRFLLLQQPTLDVNPLLKDWRAAFGSKNVIVNSIDHLDSSSELVRHMLESASVDVGRLKFRPTARKNESMDNTASLIRLISNKMALAGFKTSKRLIKSIRFEFGSNNGRLLSDDLLESVQQNFLPSYNMALESAGFDPEPSKFAGKPYDEAFYRPETREALVALVASRTKRSVRTHSSVRLVARKSWSAMSLFKT